MATIASMIYNIEAQTSSIEASLANVTNLVEQTESSMLSSITAGVALGSMFTAFGDAALEAVKSVAEAIPDLVAHTIDLGNQIYEMSLKTGASVENLSALRFVASQTGMDFDSLSTTFFMLEKNLGATGATGAKVQSALESMGLSMTQLKSESPDQAFIDIMTGLEGVSNRSDQAKDAMALFGRGAKEMMGLTQESIVDLIAEANQLGLVMTTTQAAAAHAAEVGWNAFTMQLDAAAMSIAATVLPALVALESLASQAFSTLRAQYTASGGLFSTGTIESAIDRIGEAFITSVAAAAGFASGATVGLTNVLNFAIRTGEAIVNLGAVLIKVATLGTVDEAGKTVLDKTQKALHDSYNALELLKGGVDTTASVAEAAFGAVEQVADGMSGKFHDAYATASASIADFAAKSHAAMGGVGNDVDVAGAGAKVFAKAMEDLNSVGSTWQGTLQGIDGSIEQAVEYYLKAGVSQGVLATAYGLTTVQVQAVADELKFEQAVVDATTKSHILLTATMPGLIDDQQAFQNELAGLTADGLLPADSAVDKFNKHLLLLSQIGPQARSAIASWKSPIDETIKDLQELSTDFSTLSSSLTELAKTSGGAFGSMATDLANLTKAFATTAKASEDFLKAQASGNTAGQMTAGVGMATSYVGSVSAGINQGGTGADVVGGLGSGAVSGAEIGMILGPEGAVVGGIIGGVVGGVAGLIKGLTGPSQAELASRSDRSSFMLQFQTSMDPTGIQGVEDQLTQLGVSAQSAQTEVGALLDAKTPAAFAAAMIPVNAAIIQNTNTSTAVTSVTSLVTAWTSAGHVIPASLQATIAQLATMKGMTTAEQTALASLATNSATDFGSLTTEASNLGISLAALGPKFEQGDLEQKSATMYSTLQDLTSAGGDLGGILLGASGQISSLVDESLQFGTAIPDNMQPYIQNLIDAGKLTDANGNAITSIAQLTFENTPLTTSLTTLNTAAQTLVSTLNQVPAAVAAAGGSSTGGGVPVPAFAAGVLNAPGGWAIVGEQGPEAMYVPRGANIYPTGSGASPMPGAPGATGGSGGGTVVIQLDSKTIASLVVPQLVGQIRRYGIGRNWSGAS